MPRRLRIRAALLLFFAAPFLFADEGGGGESASGAEPLRLVFHNIGKNALHSVAHNYGLNFAAAGLGTWLFIESGADWAWNRMAYNNDAISHAGLPALYIGYVVPAITPLILYGAGRARHNSRLEITGLALVQTLGLTLALQSPLKMLTGRALPGIVDDLDQSRSPRRDDFSREFSWFNMNFIGGWPSGHTANAFSAAATIAAMYDNPYLRVGVFTYAALIGLGVSVNVHWASEVFAGALIGLAVGTTVGRSFRALYDGKRHKRTTITPYLDFTSCGIIIQTQ